MTSSTARKYAAPVRRRRTGAPRRTPTRGRDAVDSSASSAAANRTSIGNVTGSRRRSISASTAAHRLARTAARGSAHSDSVNRTRRSLAKTRWLSSSRVLPRAAAPVSRPSGGLRAGNRRPVRCSRSRARLASRSSVSQVRQRGRRVGRLVGAAATSAPAPGATTARRRTRRGRARRPARRGPSSTSASGRGRSPCAAGRPAPSAATPRTGRRGRRARPGPRAAASGSAVRASQHRAVGGDQAAADHLGREVAEGRAGAVRGGRQRAGQGLRCRCRRGSPAPGRAACRAADSVVQRDAGLRPGDAGRRVDVEQPVQPRQVDLHAVGDAQRR